MPAPWPSSRWGAGRQSAPRRPGSPASTWRSSGRLIAAPCPSRSCAAAGRLVAAPCSSPRVEAHQLAGARSDRALVLILADDSAATFAVEAVAADCHLVDLRQLLKHQLQ